MFDLEDVNKETRIRMRRLYTNVDVDVKVQMVIKAPRGTMALFEYVPYRQWRIPTEKFKAKQCEVIKAFMEQHKS